MTRAVRLHGLYRLFLILGMGIVGSFTYDSIFFNFPILTTVVAFVGAVILIVNTISEWDIGDPMISRLLAREIASKFFREIFEVNPPSKKDWLAMKVCQQVVSHRLKVLKKVRNDLYEEENSRISEKLTPQGVADRIATNRNLHARVEEALMAYENAKWLAEFFYFDTYQS